MRFLKLLLCAVTIVAMTGCEDMIFTNGHTRPCCPNGKCQNGTCPNGFCPNGTCPNPLYHQSTSQIIQERQRLWHSVNWIKRDRSGRNYVDWAAAPAEIPAMDLPLDLRQTNYAGGSCVHASTESCFIWQGMPEMAEYWREHYHGGEGSEGLIAKMEANHIRYAYTVKGDESFLEWCARTRRGAVIFYFSNHSICFVDHRDGKAWLLDNNRVKNYLQVDWEPFVRSWRGYGGFALTPVYTPTPPDPS